MAAMINSEYSKIFLMVVEKLRACAPLYRSCLTPDNFFD